MKIWNKAAAFLTACIVAISGLGNIPVMAATTSRQGLAAGTYNLSASVSGTKVHNIDFAGRSFGNAKYVVTSDGSASITVNFTTGTGEIYGQKITIHALDGEYAVKKNGSWVSASYNKGGDGVVTSMTFPVDPSALETEYQLAFCAGMISGSQLQYGGNSAAALSTGEVPSAVLSIQWSSVPEASVSTGGDSSTEGGASIGGSVSTGGNTSTGGSVSTGGNTSTGGSTADRGQGANSNSNTTDNVTGSNTDTSINSDETDRTDDAAEESKTAEGEGSAADKMSKEDAEDIEDTEGIENTEDAEKEMISVKKLSALSPGTYELSAELSCYVTAMGGVEFGSPLFKDAILNVSEDGTSTITLTFGTSTINIYGVDADIYVGTKTDEGEGFIGYDNDGTWKSAEYVLDENGHVTSITFPIKEVSDSYELALVIGSQVMSTQFGNDANYNATLSVDWTQVAVDTISAPEEKSRSMTPWIVLAAVVAGVGIGAGIYFGKKKGEKS